MPLRANPEKKEEKERTRNALLRAALQLGAAHGFSSVGLREVARTAGIAPTSFYRHFADMEELGLALSEELVGASLRGVAGDAGRMAGEAGEAVRDMIDVVLDRAAADPELTRFMLAELAGCSPSLRAALRVHVSQLAGALRDRFQRPEQQHTIPHELAEAAVALLLDGCLRELETPRSDRAELRPALHLSLCRLLTPSDSRSAT